MDSDHSRWIGTHRLVAHLLRRMAGMPSGPGAESSFISDIASTYLVRCEHGFSVATDEGRHLESRDSFAGAVWVTEDGTELMLKNIG